MNGNPFLRFNIYIVPQLKFCGWYQQQHLGGYSDIRLSFYLCSPQRTLPCIPGSPYGYLHYLQHIHIATHYVKFYLLPPISTFNRPGALNVHCHLFLQQKSQVRTKDKTLYQSLRGEKTPLRAHKFSQKGEKGTQIAHRPNEL